MSRITPVDGTRTSTAAQLIFHLLSIIGEEVTTSRRSNATNPQFDDGGLFYIKNVATAILKIQVWDHNAVPIPDTFMGELSVPIAVNNKQQLFTKDLVLKKSGEDGSTSTTTGARVSFKYAVSTKLDYM